MATAIDSGHTPIRFRRSSAFRVALLLAALFALFAVIAAGLMWLGTERAMRHEQREEMRADAHDLVLLSYQGGMDRLATEIDERSILNTGLVRWYALYAANGVRLAGNLPTQPQRTGWSQQPFLPQVSAREPHPPPHLLTLLTLRTAHDGWLLVGRDSHDIAQIGQVAGRIFLAALLLMVTSALLVGGLLGRRMSRRIGGMRAIASRISDGELSLRMPVHERHDELDVIAGTVNDMLGRIAALLAGMRRLGADIAHDLRTPLTRLRQRIERLQQTPDDAGQVRTDAGLALAELDEILGIFQALLRIARVDAGDARQQFTVLPLDQLLAELAEAFGPVAEAEGHVLSLRLATARSVCGDRELLTQALVNLIENAIRHTPPGTPIELALRGEGAQVVVSVRDRGAGIPAEEREEMLRPFARRDASRHTEGNGLGLALVASVAELHRATLKLDDAQPGLCVSLAFSVSSTPPHTPHARAA